PARSVGLRHRKQSLPDGFLQSFWRSGSHTTQDGLDFGESLFNGRKIWRVRREEQHVTPSGFDDLSHFLSFMNTQIIHNHRLPWLQAWPKNLLKVDFKELGIGSSLKNHRFPYS